MIHRAGCATIVAQVGVTTDKGLLLLWLLRLHAGGEAGRSRLADEADGRGMTQLLLQRFGQLLVLGGLELWRLGGGGGGEGLRGLLQILRRGGRRWRGLWSMGGLRLQRWSLLLLLLR